MKSFAIFGILVIMITVSGCYEPDVDAKDISIACWNLQIFGMTKAGDVGLLDYYADKIDEYDICIIQEIRDKSEMAVKYLAVKLPGYEYILSQRAGSTQVKEQYAVFYRYDVVSVEVVKDYTFTWQDFMERPPIMLTFDYKGWEFNVYTMHTDPDTVGSDLMYFEEIVDVPGVSDRIILGDLNADGSYYDEDNIIHFDDWNWVIGNHVDTTVAVNDYTYDRILVNDDCMDNFVRSGVMDDVVSGQSDHYLVYGVFEPRW